MKIRLRSRAKGIASRDGHHLKRREGRAPDYQAVLSENRIYHPPLAKGRNLEQRETRGYARLITVKAAIRVIQIYRGNAQYVHVSSAIYGSTEHFCGASVRASKPIDVRSQGNVRAIFHMPSSKEDSRGTMVTIRVRFSMPLGLHIMR